MGRREKAGLDAARISGASTDPSGGMRCWQNHPAVVVEKTEVVAWMRDQSGASVPDAAGPGVGIIVWGDGRRRASMLLG